MQVALEYTSLLAHPSAGDNQARIEEVLRDVESLAATNSASLEVQVHRCLVGFVRSLLLALALHHS